MLSTSDNRVLAAAAAVSLAMLSSACGADNDRGAASQPSTTQSQSAVTTTVEQSPISKDVAPVAAAQAALRTAAGAVPEGQPFDLELEKSGGELQFEAKVTSNGTQHKVVVDSTGEQVVSKEESSQSDDDAAKLDGTKITAGQALQAASQQVPDAQFHEMEIDTDDTGAVGWEVELVRTDGTDAEFHVNAQSGAVTPKK